MTDSLNSETVAIYARVSSAEQSLEGQERDLREYAASRGWTDLRVYAEKESATGKVLREEYDRLNREAGDPNRPWKHLLVWSLDRWSREERFTLAVLAIEELEAKGVHFHSFKEPMIDTTEDGQPNIGRDLLRAILPVIAAFESRRKSERVRVAMREIREGRRQTKSGKPPGRPRRVTSLHIRRIKECRAEGLTWKQVAQQVGLPAGTCKNALRTKNPSVEKGAT